jgi:hypothetical protein
MKVGTRSVQRGATLKIIVEVEPQGIDEKD